MESRSFPGRQPDGSHVLKNGAGGNYLRLSSDEYFIWQRLDGRSVRQLLADYLAEYGSLAPARVLELLGHLRAAGMLADPPRALYSELAERLTARSWGRRAEQLLRATLFAEQPLPGAGPASRWAYRAGGWLLFSRPTMVGLVLVALGGLVVYLNLLQRGTFELVTTGGSFALGFLVFGVANAFATLAAEGARALATVHHGRQVRAGGLRMMLAMPTVFVDTRDIWMENRRARLSVAAAGPFGLFVSAGAAALILHSSPDGPLADFLFKFALLCYGTAIFYLNPLVELDGYALLSEWLEQPNLRERSLDYVRTQLVDRLRRRQSLDRRERVLASFGILAVAFGLYTVAGGMWFFGWRTIAGVEELWKHENAAVRSASIVAAVLAGAAFALASALVMARAIGRAYGWAERRGLLASPERLTAAALAGAVLLAAGAFLVPVHPAIYRGVVAPPLLMLVVVNASRIRQDYRGTLLRWFFNALAVFAALVFVGEELAALRALLDLYPAWTGQAERAISLAGLAVCLPFGIALASLMTSRYRLPLGQIGSGIGLYALHTFIPAGRVDSALAALASGQLVGGVLLYSLLARRVRARASDLALSPALDDAARLAQAFELVVAHLLDEVVAQSGRRAATDLQRRFNHAAEAAGWGLTLAESRPGEAQRRDLISARAVYRQALALLLDQAVARCGEPFVARALTQARDSLPWDRREVLDAWVLAELPLGREAMGQARAERAELASFLRRVPLLAGFDPGDLDLLIEALRPRRVPAGRRIIRQGDSGDAFYLIRSGLADVRKRDPGGSEHSVARLGEGAGFGELALLHDRPRNATVRALTPMELLVLNRPDFDRFIRERYDFLGKLGPAVERQRLLAAMPLFRELPADVRAALAASLDELEVPVGQDVVRQGEAGDAFYVIRSGRLTVTVHDEAGRRRPVATLGRGEYFGEMALLNDQPRSATVAALEPSGLFVLRKADFERLLWGQAGASRSLELVASRRRLDQEAKSRAQLSP